MKYIRFGPGKYNFTVFEDAELFILRNGTVQAMRVWLRETERELSGWTIEQAAAAAVARGWSFSRMDNGPCIFREFKKTKAKVSRIDWDVNLDISLEEGRILGLEIELSRNVEYDKAMGTTDRR